jgi:hypothetical protein
VEEHAEEVLCNSHGHGQTRRIRPQAAQAKAKAPQHARRRLDPLSHGIQSPATMTAEQFPPWPGCPRERLLSAGLTVRHAVP